MGDWHFASVVQLFLNIKELTMLSREAYIAKMKVQLDEFDAKMDELEAQAKAAKAGAQGKYDEEMARLRKQAILAKAKVEELKAAGADRWDAMVVETEKVRDAFVHAVNYFKSQL
jgi:hypothetical protein